MLRRLNTLWLTSVCVGDGDGSYHWPEIKLRGAAAPKP